MIGAWEGDRRHACTIAADHLRWATTKGKQSLADIMLSIGETAKPGMGEDDVLIALERAWLMVCRPYRKARTRR
jgi:hypothetical protein